LIAAGYGDVHETDGISVLVWHRPCYSCDSNREIDRASLEHSLRHSLCYFSTDRGMCLDQIWRDAECNDLLLLRIDDKSSLKYFTRLRRISQ
jgi:hypothetical protein